MFGSLLAIAKLEAVTSVYAQLCPFVLNGWEMRQTSFPSFQQLFCRATRQSEFDFSKGHSLFSVHFEKGIRLMSALGSAQ
jgi:hypothetical protein